MEFQRNVESLKICLTHQLCTNAQLVNCWTNSSLIKKLLKSVVFFIKKNFFGSIS